MIQAASAVRIGEVRWGVRTVLGCQIHPRGWSTYFPQLQLAAADILGIAFTQDSLLKTGQCEGIYVPPSPPYSHQIWMVTQLQSCLWGHWCLCCNCLMFKASHYLIWLPSLPLPGLILKHSQINVLLANLLITMISWGAYPAKVGTRCC